MENMKGHLKVERVDGGFKVSVVGRQHQVFIMLGVLVADICEMYKVSPHELAKDLPKLVQMVVNGEEK